MKDRPIIRRRRRVDIVREEPPAIGAPPIILPAPPLRVGTTAWRVADPGARLTHEFHLRLPCRPVHVGLIGAALVGVRIVEDENLDLLAEAAPFKESSIETTPQGIRVDYDLETPSGAGGCPPGENLVVFVDFEVTLRVKGQVTILLIFETPASAPK